MSSPPSQPTVQDAVWRGLPTASAVPSNFFVWHPAQVRRCPALRRPGERGPRQGSARTGTGAGAGPVVWLLVCRVVWCCAYSLRVNCDICDNIRLRYYNSFHILIKRGTKSRWVDECDSPISAETDKWGERNNKLIRLSRETFTSEVFSIKLFLLAFNSPNKLPRTEVIVLQCYWGVKMTFLKSSSLTPDIWCWPWETLPVKSSSKAINSRTRASGREVCHYRRHRRWSPFMFKP